MRILIGIITAHCPSRTEYIAAARETWLKDCKLDYKFVFGNPESQNPPMPRRTALSDELFVECDDTRAYMVHKNQALFKYALEAGYDFCFRCCDDTFVNPHRLLVHGLEQYDYAGCLGGWWLYYGNITWPMKNAFMHGGCGVWLSRKAMHMLVADEWSPETCPYPSPHNVFYPDDGWMGEVLQGKLPWKDARRETWGKSYFDNGIAIYSHGGLFALGSFDATKVVAAHDVKRFGNIPKLFDVENFSNKGEKSSWQFKNHLPLLHK